MVFLLKDYLRFDSLELGLEIANGMAVGAAIGATTSVGERIAVVILLFTGTAPIPLISCLSTPKLAADLPIALAASFFLHFLRVGIGVARLGEVAREMLLDSSRAVGEPGMITVIELVRAGH